MLRAHTGPQYLESRGVPSEHPSDLFASTPLYCPQLLFFFPNLCLLPSGG
jgi:hypothetical protein